MRFLLCTLLLGISAPVTWAAEVHLPRIDERFAQTNTETPDFQKHLIPMLSKLGCNGRSCHGSFQGRGGFQLSLFGYDFEMDHKNLSERIDTDDPLESYALHKATNVEEHEGGQRIQPDSWEYRVLVNWIQAGAKGTETESQLQRLEITPSEIRFQNDTENVQLKVIAVWQDGLREDVTPLSRFQSNDTSIAEVTEAGLVSAAAVGDTHVVVFYDNGTVPIPVIRPVSSQTGDRYPVVETPTRVDELVVEKLRKLGIVPSETCSDSDFLRRVTLDITGTLPSPDQVREFLADGSADKRSRKIDELLETPAYAAWWATRLSDYTGNTGNQMPNVSFNNTQAVQEWHAWLNKRVADNVPYDQIVEGIVLATSQREGESYADFSARMGEYYLDKTGEKFAEQESLPYYWSRRNFQKTEDRAIGFAYTFLGIRIQCAQCHKHPFDQWTQDDFKEFQPLFSKTRFSLNGPNRKDYEALLATLDVDQSLKGNQLRRQLAVLVKEGEVIPFPTLIQQGGRVNPRRAKGKQAPEIQARVLGGQPFDMNQYADPREPLMAWLTGEARQLFAKAFVNRVWANYFHRGIVEPTDDLSLANPPTNQALLDHLTQGFLDHDYDMKWLHREICNSRTYQLSWQPNKTNQFDERNFSRAVPRRLQAEIAYDALVQATAGSDTNATFISDLQKRAIAIPGSAQGRGGSQYALVIFGKSARENNCDCERSSEATLLQTLFLFNDNEMLSAIDARDGWLKELSSEWKQPFLTNLNAGQKPKPENYTEIVQRYQKQLTRLENLGNKEKYQAVKARLKAYRAQYGPEFEAAPVPGEKPRLVAPLPRENQEQAITEAYLRTLSRYPTTPEMEASLQAIAGSETAVEGMRDLLWALLNTKEFIVNH